MPTPKQEYPKLYKKAPELEYDLKGDIRDIHGKLDIILTELETIKRSISDLQDRE